jgi:nucleotide-binding universal stress UspA family protein
MFPEYKTILYATDLGRTAPRVFRHALSLADRYGGCVVVLHAVEPLGPSARHMVELYAGAAAAHQDESRWQQVQERLRERLSGFCANEPCRGADGRELVADLRVVRGRPSEVILQEAARIAADAIVMGTHGHTTVGEIFLGSTAHRVAQKSPVPVLLVRVAESDTAAGL